MATVFKPTTHGKYAYETFREFAKRNSNNHLNNSQNVCIQAVAFVLNGANEKVRYLHNCEDLIRAVRLSGFQVRSRKSNLKKNATVGSAREVIKKLKAKEEEKFFWFQVPTRAYIVRLEGHILLLDGEGKTIVDTDPRKVDRRKVTGFYAVSFLHDVKNAEMHMNSPIYRKDNEQIKRGVY